MRGWSCPHRRHQQVGTGVFCCSWLLWCIYKARVRVAAPSRGRAGCSWGGRALGFAKGLALVQRCMSFGGSHATVPTSSAGEAASPGSRGSRSSGLGEALIEFPGAWVGLYSGDEPEPSPALLWRPGVSQRASQSTASVGTFCERGVAPARWTAAALSLPGYHLQLPGVKAFGASSRTADSGTACARLRP